MIYICGFLFNFVYFSQPTLIQFLDLTHIESVSPQLMHNVVTNIEMRSATRWLTICSFVRHFLLLSLFWLTHTKYYPGCLLNSEFHPILPTLPILFSSTTNYSQNLSANCISANQQGQNVDQFQVHSKKLREIL